MNKYSVLEKIAVIFHRPYMKYRILKYSSLGVSIGQNCKIFSDLKFAEPYLVSIGDNVTISVNVQIITHDNCVIKFTQGTDIVGKVKIGNNCFIGAGAILLPGINLGNNVVVGAGSVVTKSFGNNVVVVGNPARVLCRVEDVATKNENFIFDFSKCNKRLRKEIIDAHPERLIER